MGGSAGGTGDGVEHTGRRKGSACRRPNTRDPCQLLPGLADWTLNHAQSRRLLRIFESPTRRARSHPQSRDPRAGSTGMAIRSDGTLPPRASEDTSTLHSRLSTPPGKAVPARALLGSPVSYYLRSHSHLGRTAAEHSGRRIAAATAREAAPAVGAESTPRRARRVPFTRRRSGCWWVAAIRFPLPRAACRAMAAAARRAEPAERTPERRAAHGERRSCQPHEGWPPIAGALAPQRNAPQTP